MCLDARKDRKRKQKPAKIVTFDDDDLSSLSASPASSVVSPVAGPGTAHQASSNLEGRANAATTSLANQRVNREPGVGSETSQDFRSIYPSSVQTSNVYRNSNSSDKFSFETSEHSSVAKDSAISSRQPHAAGNATSNFNGYSKNSYNDQLRESNNVQSGKSNSLKSVGNAVKSDGCIDMDSFKTTPLGIGLASTNIDHRTSHVAGGGSELSMHKAQSTDNLRRTTVDLHSNYGLYHSNSEASKLSLASSFPTDYL